MNRGKQFKFYIQISNSSLKQIEKATLRSKKMLDPFSSLNTLLRVCRILILPWPQRRAKRPMRVTYLKYRPVVQFVQHPLQVAEILFDCFGSVHQSSALVQSSPFREALLTAIIHSHLHLNRRIFNTHTHRKKLPF